MKGLSSPPVLLRLDERDDAPLEPVPLMDESELRGTVAAVDVELPPRRLLLLLLLLLSISRSFVGLIVDVVDVDACNC